MFTVKQKIGKNNNPYYVLSYVTDEQEFAVTYDKQLITLLCYASGNKLPKGNDYIVL